MTMLRYGNPLADATQRFAGRFVGGRLFMIRSFEDEPERGWDVEAFELDRIDNAVRSTREFNIRQGVDQSEHNFVLRTALDPEAATSCTDHAVLDRSLEVRDGQLTYRAGTGSETSR